MLKTHEILDRFEILYPEKEELKHLRRLYIDQDLHSLFRLVAADDDIRKAILEKNLHSLFRLSDSDEDIRKAILEKNLHSLFRLSDSDEDLRKAVLEKNLHSVFRLVDKTNKDLDIDDLRKAVLDQNIHSIMRLIDAPDDLRKSVIDQNIHSIMRLIDAPDDLRKSVIDQNIHSIMRLIDAPDDLRKFVLQDNKWSLWRLLGEYVTTEFVSALKHLISNKINFDKDCFSRGQITSKLWLIAELKKLDLNLGTVFLCAGWYATLATMLLEEDFKIDKIRSFDVDTTCIDIAERFNKVWEMNDWKFKAVTADILDLNFSNTSYTLTKPDNSVIKILDTPDTIINTSCEHIENFSQWYSKIPAGKLVVLQSNDYFEIEDHVNCSKNLNDFAESTPMTDCLFSGVIDLGKYRRFMRIGYR